jgi:hypothetical protein
MERDFIRHLADFQVVELRRYIIKEGAHRIIV